MNWIDKYVAVGSWKSVFLIDNLKNEDIDLIIDARTLFDVAHGRPKKPLVNKVLKAGDMIEALTHFDAKVLIHCTEGIDRTPFLAMVYVSKKYDMPYREAYEFVKSKRPETIYHWDWMEMLGERKSRVIDVVDFSMKDGPA
ncbi:MAG: dual specificity protein phosphatase family protein [Methanomassiliicoccales archaeon]